MTYADICRAELREIRADLARANAPAADPDTAYLQNRAADLARELRNLAYLRLARAIAA